MKVVKVLGGGGNVWNVNIVLLFMNGWSCYLLWLLNKMGNGKFLIVLNCCGVWCGFVKKLILIFSV